MTTKIALVGASGRTGSLVISVLPEFSDVELCAALVSSSSSKIAVATSVAGVSFSSDLNAGIKTADVVIDFSTPATTALVVDIAAQLKKPLLVATTGLLPQQIQQIERAATSAPILVASNTSVGVFVMTEIAVRARQLLGPSFDVEILESHHRHKKDAPSGTALSIARGLKEDSGFDLVTGRASLSRLRGEREIAVESLRGGDVAGEHTVYFFGRGERIEITHRVSDRAVFARGAIRLALALQGKPARLYTVAELIR